MERQKKLKQKREVGNHDSGVVLQDEGVCGFP